MYITSLLPLFVCWLSCVLAAPPGIHKRDSSVGPKTWVPILVIGALLILITLLSCRRKAFRTRWTNWGAGAAIASGSVAHLPSSDGGVATRELTADELTRTTRNNTTGNGNAASRTTTTTPPTTGTTGRRARRPRRTPSQMSTKSLPAYNREAGDEELVIYSGPPEEGDEDQEEGEEETLDSATTAVMSTIEENQGSRSSHDNRRSLASIASLPGHVDASAQAPGATSMDGPIRPSYETMIASDESSSALMAPGIDPRGDAPAYETINLDDHQESTRLYQARESPTESVQFPRQAQHTQAPTGRMSGFLNFFMPRGNTNSDPASESTRNLIGHSRDGSGPSLVTLTSVESHGTPRGGRPRRGHRSNNSSASGINLSAFRTISRTMSNTTSNDSHGNPLTSPSLISLNSISAPLTHTAMRTEFTYPRSGPTPDQVKFISSRETFGRFGLPYGPDAVAFAASASRQDLSIPPPDFEAVDSSIRPSIDVPRPAAEANSSASSSAIASQDPSSSLDGTLPVDETAPAEATPPSPTSSSSSSDASSPTPAIVLNGEPAEQPSQKPAPSSFRFDLNQPLSPDTPLARSASVASSYATFETAPDSAPPTPIAHQINIFSASNPSLSSLHPAQPHDSADEESDSGESIRSGAVPAGHEAAKEEEALVSESSEEESSEEEQTEGHGKEEATNQVDDDEEEDSDEDDDDEEDEDATKNITNTTRHVRESTDATITPAEPKLASPPLSPAQPPTPDSAQPLISAEAH